MIRSRVEILLSSLLLFGCVACQSEKHYDVVVVGGGASGTAAALTAARNGAHTLLVEQSEWLGGMLTAAGVSATDGNYHLRGGFWGEFRDSLEARYGGADALKTGWVSHILFEPSVGNQIFQHMAQAVESLDLSLRSTLDELSYEEGMWHLRIATPNGLRRIEAPILIDATELGDVVDRLDIPYDVGMEAASETGEQIAPEQAHPIVQDLTYVAILKEYATDQTIEPPVGYTPSTYACCCLNARCVTPTEPNRMWPKEMMLNYGRLPNGKYMINWPIEGNDYYLNLIEASPREREEALQRAKNHTLGFLYFIQTELGYNQLGLADDEFPTADRLPWIPYHRESRRIHGRVRFTLEHLMHPYDHTLYRTAIAVGDYPIDQHHARYTGSEELPDLHYHPIPPYGLPLGVLFPEAQPGLIVAEKSISVSNLVNGSTRLQPVVLQIGEAAGAVAVEALRRGCLPHEVSVRAVQELLLSSGGYLLPFRDLPASDPHFRPLQRIAVTGILPLRGEHVGWENVAWLDIEQPISEGELRANLHRLYPLVELSDRQTNVTGATLKALLVQSGEITEEQFDREALARAIPTDGRRPLSRLECALLIDTLLNPFAHEVDLDGNFLR